MKVDKILIFWLLGSFAFAEDMQAVGPGGEVMIYYKDHDDIVIKNCGKRSDCTTVDKENRVPVEVFKRALKSEFQINDADKLPPLTPNEIKAYHQANGDNLNDREGRKEELDAKLARIAEFASNPDDRTQILQSFDSVRQELTTAQGGGAAVKKLNDLVNDLVDRKIASSAKTSVSSAHPRDLANYVFLKRFDASRPECGKRRGDCQKLPKSSVTHHNSKTGQDVVWKLVARKRSPSTGKFYEVWQDSKTGVLWGDLLDHKYTQYNAEAQCNSDEGKSAIAGVSEKTFKLPTKQDFETAKDDGIFKVLPNRNHWFWSSSGESDHIVVAWVFNPHVGDIYYNFRSYYNSVRCVAR